MEVSNFNLSQTFKALGKLVNQQAKATGQFNAKNAYGENENSDLNTDAMKLIHLAYSDMGLAKSEGLKDWKLNLKMKSKDLIDSETLFENLRKLPNNDIMKIRIFNRIVGQQLLTTTISDLFELQERKLGEYINPFYNTFCQQIQSFASLFDQKIEGPEWPKEKLVGSDREQLMRDFESWRKEWLELPGFRIAKDFFEKNDDLIFNAFFHLQRQFDSENWKDFDKEELPYPQSLPKIFSYRKALQGMSQEFDNAEASVNMCFDYCRMNKDKVVSFVLEAENAFLNIVTQLDDQYPLELDYAHFELHEQSHKVKLMMFPLRCLFFDELESYRGVKDSNDHTLDSYMDMTLVENDVFLPADYIHQTSVTDLETELQSAFMDLFKNPDLEQVDSVDMVRYIQKMSQEELEKHAKVMDGLCDIYEDKFKSQEGNLSRRFSRLCYLYLKAMEKKSDMKKASQDRLDSIQAMADKYSAQAEKFAEMDMSDENADITKLSDDQLPLMASPQQMEDLYRTQKVIQRLSGSDDNFTETAKQIQAGLESALKMMKEAGELMERMIVKIFPQKHDQEDLLKAIREMINIGYSTQTSLADLAKKESMSQASKNPKLQKEIETLKKEIEESKQKTQSLQMQLKDILGVKRELVKGMRITQGEKDNHLNQLRMITVMTINSLNSQK